MSVKPRRWRRGECVAFIAVFRVEVGEVRRGSRDLATAGLDVITLSLQECPQIGPGATKNIGSSGLRVGDGGRRMSHDGWRGAESADSGCDGETRLPAADEGGIIPGFGAHGRQAIRFAGGVGSSRARGGGGPGKQGPLQAAEGRPERPGRDIEDPARGRGMVFCRSAGRGEPRERNRPGPIPADPHSGPQDLGGPRRGPGAGADRPARPVRPEEAQEREAEGEGVAGG